METGGGNHLRRKLFTVARVRPDVRHHGEAPRRGTCGNGDLAIFLGGAAIAERPDKTFFQWATTSRAIADEQWGFFARAVGAPAPSSIRYFIPDNNYGLFGDVFVILLKGASDFGTWEVSTNRQWIIDRYAPGLKFVTDLNPKIGSLDHARLVWFDAPWLAKIPRFPPITQY